MIGWNTDTEGGATCDHANNPDTCPHCRWIELSELNEERKET